MIGGDYDHPKVRLPGAGGAPEIAASCGEVIVIVRQSTRAFVEKVDFVTSVGHGSGPGDREKLGLRGKGPTRVITDLGILEPDPETRELVLTHVHPGVTAEQAQEATGWDLKIAGDLKTTEPPTDDELERAARAGGRDMSDAYILDAVRTPFGRYGGALAKVRPDDLGAHVVKALLGALAATSTPRRSTTSASATPTAPARTTATSRAWRCCSRACRRASPATPSTASAAPASTPRCRRAARSRPATPTSSLVGGVESMSRAPWVVLKPEKGFPAGPSTMHSTTLGWRMVNPDMPDQWTISLGESTEKLAGIYEIGREAQDAFALQQPPARRRRLGRRLLRRLGRSRSPSTELARDEGIRADTIAREAGQAQAGVRQGRHGDRGQRVAAQRRRVRAC